MSSTHDVFSCRRSANINCGTVAAVDLVWNPTRERLTIGGALVLRQEDEFLARLQDRSALTVHLISQETDRPASKRMAQIIFGTSILAFHRLHSKEGADGWPSAAVRSRSDFSYFAFSRIVDLHAQTGLRPSLRWSDSQEASALQARRHFPGRLHRVHLRSVAPPSRSQRSSRCRRPRFRPGQPDPASM